MIPVITYLLQVTFLLQYESLKSRLKVRTVRQDPLFVVLDSSSQSLSPVRPSTPPTASQLPVSPRNQAKSKGAPFS